MHVRAIFFALCLPATFCYAQDNDTLNVAHIKSYPDHFFLWPVLKQRGLNFRIRDLEENRSVRYRPNNSYALGLGAYVFDISFELTFAIPLNERNRDVFGKSSARDFQINALSRKWGADLFIQRYHGFYSDIDLSAGALTTLPSRPDIIARNTGLTGLYVFHPDRYSLRSAFNFSERQLISGGSLMLTGTISTFKADAEGAITQVDEPDSGGALMALRYTTLSLAPGYAYTFVRDNFFASGAVMAGPAHNWVYYQKEDNSTTHDIQFNTFASVRLGIGYSTDVFFAGLNFVQQSRTVKFDNLRFTSNSSTFRLLVGFRFRESGILKKNVADLPAELRKI